MFQNNNQTAMKTMAKQSLKANPMRNLLAIVAIALTTILFTSMFTIGMSMVKSLEYSTMRQVGTSAHGGFKYLTEDQFKKLKEHKAIKQYGFNILVGMAKNEQLAKRQVQIQYMDDLDAKYSFVAPLMAGTMPEAENEIVLDTIVLDMLGLSHDLGQRVTLDFAINDKFETQEFFLSGYYQGDKVSLSSLALVSKNFVERALSGIDLKESIETGSMAGYINLDVMLNNKWNTEAKLQRILTDSGFAVDQIPYGVNWAYLGTKLFDEPSNILPVIGLLLLIMLSGYLIIYNIFYISVVKDIRFYGLLKTIGTTTRQLKTLIIRQAVVLSLLGIPIGLMLGYFIGVLLTPYVIRTITATHSAISASPLIFAGAALFSLMTVLISCRRPAKIASSISPIEAVRYTGISTGSKKKVKESVHGAKLHRMAFSNLFRSKRKAITAIASLSLSLILLNSVYHMVIGFDLDKYIKRMSGSDFTIGDASFYRWNFRENAPNALSEQLCQEVAGLNGVQSLDKIYYKQAHLPLSEEMEQIFKNNMSFVDEMYRPALENVLTRKTMPLEVYGLDSGLFGLLEDYVVDGSVDADLWQSGSYVILKQDMFLDDLYRVGDQITLPSDQGEPKVVTVMAIVSKLPLYLYNGRSVIGGGSVYIPSQLLYDLEEDPSIMTALFNVKEDQRQEIEHYLAYKVKEIPALDYRSKLMYETEYKEMVNTFSTVGYSLSFIIGFIGLLNFTNVMITGILARRREFATMQSIGMTVKQLKRVLCLEGLYYALITVSVSLSLGLPIASWGIQSITRTMPYFSYHFSVLPIMLSSPLLMTISLLVPILGLAGNNKSSVVERLREIE